MAKGVVKHCPECHAKLIDENRSVCPECGKVLIEKKDEFNEKAKKLLKKNKGCSIK